MRVEYLMHVASIAINTGLKPKGVVMKRGIFVALILLGVSFTGMAQAAMTRHSRIDYRPYPHPCPATTMKSHR